MDPTQVVVVFTLIGLSYVRGQTTGGNQWAPMGTTSSWNPSPTSSSSSGNPWNSGGPPTSPVSSSFNAMGMNGLSGMSGMGNMGGMSGMSGMPNMAAMAQMQAMMNPSSQMMALANMQSRLGDNFVFNPNPPEVVYNACPYFTTLRQCTVNPCPLRCKRYPGAKCVTNPCGGCSPEWYSGGQRILDCD